MSRVTWPVNHLDGPTSSFKMCLHFIACLLSRFRRVFLGGGGKILNYYIIDIHSH